MVRSLVRKEAQHIAGIHWRGIQTGIHGFCHLARNGIKQNCFMGGLVTARLRRWPCFSGQIDGAKVAAQAEHTILNQWAARVLGQAAEV